MQDALKSDNTISFMWHKMPYNRSLRQKSFNRFLYLTETAYSTATKFYGSCNVLFSKPLLALTPTNKDCRM